MPFVDSRHLFSTLDFFTLDSRYFYSRLSTFLLSTLDFLVSTLVFYSRLSTFTLDSRHLLSTLDPRLLDTLHANEPLSKVTGDYSLQYRSIEDSPLDFLRSGKIQPALMWFRATQICYQQN